MSDINEPTKEALPWQVKRRAQKKQASTNDRLKAKADAAGKVEFKNSKHVDLMAFNADAEDAFVELVRKLIEKAPGGLQVAISKVYQEGAYRLNVSTQTVKRYLIKYSAETAPLRVFGKAVMLNPNYSETDEDE